MKRFFTLLRRECWENNLTIRSFFAITLSMTIGISLYTFLVVSWVSKKFGGKIETQDLLAARHLEASMNGAGHGVIAGFSILVFFYCVRSLYNERKDQSNLFWRSMPISDGMIVLSKAFFALVVIPAFALGVLLVTHVLALAIFSLFALLVGLNPINTIILQSNPLPLWERTASFFFITSLWILPSVGWLMLASSYARNKVFLWAILPPLGIGLISSLVRGTGASLPSDWIWAVIVARSFPISNFFIDNFKSTFIYESLAPTPIPSITNLLLSTEMLIGAVAGIGMLYVATKLRRSRELNS